MTMKAPVGPPICTRLPEKTEISRPATIACTALFGLDAGGDGKGDGERQGDDADDQAGHYVLESWRGVSPSRMTVTSFGVNSALIGCLREPGRWVGPSGLLVGLSGRHGRGAL